MRTKSKTKGKVAIVLSLALVGSMLLPVRTGTKTTQAAEEVPEVREINLNNEGTIPGIMDPNQPKESTDTWSGSYVYFGNYWQSKTDVKEPIRWRVLSTGNDHNEGTDIQGGVAASF